MGRDKWHPAKKLDKSHCGVAMVYADIDGHKVEFTEETDLNNT